jgi:hypothetical protein
MSGLSPDQMRHALRGALTFGLSAFAERAACSKSAGALGYVVIHLKVFLQLFLYFRSF